MDLSQSRLRSLKDTLLEYTVLNMNLFFPTGKTKPTLRSFYPEKNDIVSIPAFPNYLFEEILEKSKDMCWPVYTWQLRTCMAAKDRLNWIDTSISRFVDYFVPKDLELFNVSIRALKTLAINLSVHNGKNFFNKISEASDTLEDLDITVNAPKNYNHLDKVEGTSLRLKRFTLCSFDFQFDHLPFTLAPEKLTVLELTEVILTKTFLKTLVGFKQLVHLSLSLCSLREFSLEEMIVAAATLKCLRILRLQKFLDELMLNKIVENISSIEILEIWKITLRHPERLLAPKRKLKVLNCCKISTSDASALTRLAHRIGHFENLQGLMTFVSTTPVDYLFQSAAEALFRLIHNEGVEYKTLDEAEKRGIFNFRSDKRLSECVYSGECRSTSYGLLLRMVCFGMNNDRTRNLQFLKDWTMDYIKSNENTHLAKKFNKILNC